jgi:hypothetical protein
MMKKPSQLTEIADWRKKVKEQQMNSGREGDCAGLWS